ncbi:MAG: hypothetical protein GY953_31655 [bacterium]|nr:hypothetical protein [bacterium]
MSTPNLVWWPVVRLATLARIRPYDGLENFSTFGGMRRTLADAGVEVLRQKGLHLFPFQIPLHRLYSWGDEHLQLLKSLMINICILGRKRVHGAALPGNDPVR